MIEITMTNDDGEKTVEHMLRREGYEPHAFITRYTRPGVSGPKPDTHTEQIWEKPDVQILVRRITWGQ